MLDLDSIFHPRVRLSVVALVALAGSLLACGPAADAAPADPPVADGPVDDAIAPPPDAAAAADDAAPADDAATRPDTRPPSGDTMPAGDAFDAPPRPANQVLLDGGAYLMALTDGTDTYDFVIVADALDGTNPLNALHAGWTLVSPPDPFFTTHIDTAQSYPACGYADWLDGLDPAFNPCFGPGTTNVVDIHTTTTAGKPATGQMTWNALGFVRSVVGEPQHLTVKEFFDGLPRNITTIRTEHVGPGVAIPESGGDLELAAGVDFGAATLDRSGTKLYDADGVTLSLDTASISSRPSIKTSLSMSKGKVHHVKVELDDDFSANLAVTLSAARSYKKDVTQRIFSYSKTLPPLDVAGVPLVETLRLDIDAHCSVDIGASITATAGVALHQHTVLGAEFTDGVWSNVSSVGDPVLTAVPPAIRAKASSTLICEITPVFTLLFYDLAGPSLSATATARMFLWSSAAPDHAFDWKIDGEFKGILGIGTNPSIPFVGSALAKELAGANVTLFDYSKTILNGTL